MLLPYGGHYYLQVTPTVHSHLKLSRFYNFAALPWSSIYHKRSCLWGRSYKMGQDWEEIFKWISFCVFINFFPKICSIFEDFSFGLLVYFLVYLLVDVFICVIISRSISDLKWKRDNISLIALCPADSSGIIWVRPTFIDVCFVGIFNYIPESPFFCIMEVCVLHVLYFLLVRLAFVSMSYIWCALVFVPFVDNYRI